MTGAADRPRILVTATPPTPNGDLHVGHLAGPYLAADVFARAQRRRGAEAIYVSGGDDSQTYVVTTADRVGSTPEALAAECNEKIRETLRLAEVEIDAFTQPDAEYPARIQRFFADLHERGAFELRSYNFPIDPETGRAMLEAFASGFCPECYAPTAGAICEACGHPNDPNSLLSAGGAKLESTPIEVLVLPLERYRDRFEDYYERHRGAMRPHVLRFVAEMLARPLPDWPITYPAAWGVPANFGPVTDQVINVWAEMLAALGWMAEVGEGMGATPWAAGSGYRLVQFLGYDNTFYFSIAHLALCFAHGGLIEPEAILTNEMYELEGSKFSTSRRHLIWARDLIGRYGATDVRFYLALANPEQQTANFIPAEFEATVARRMHEPLGELERALAPRVGGRVEIRPEDWELYEAFRERMERSYAVETFSLRATAETFANLLAMLASRVGNEDHEVASILAGLWIAVDSVEPLLPSFARELREELSGGESPAARAPLPSTLVVPALSLDRPSLVA